MIKKSFIVFGILFIALAIVFSLKPGKNDKEKMLPVQSIPLHDSSGWGYDILVDHKVYIHQPYIPAIMGEKKFFSKEDALKTADLVIQKLKSRKLPVITKDDLDALKIYIK